MIRKIIYGLPAAAAWLAMTGVAGAQTSYEITNSQTQVSPVAGGIFALVWLVVILLILAALWKIFSKAGKPGWAAIIPIYNYFVQLQIVGRPLWWFILLLIPFVNIIIGIIILNDLSKSFGKGPGFTVGLLLLPIIFFPILGFGKATYQGPLAAAPAMTPQQPPMPPTQM